MELDRSRGRQCSVRQGRQPFVGWLCRALRIRQMGSHKGAGIRGAHIVDLRNVNLLCLDRRLRWRVVACKCIQRAGRRRRRLARPSDSFPFLGVDQRHGRRRRVVANASVVGAQRRAGRGAVDARRARMGRDGGGRAVGAVEMRGLGG